MSADYGMDGRILDGGMQVRTGTRSQSRAGSASAHQGAFQRVGIPAVGRSVIVPHGARIRMTVIGRHVEGRLRQARQARRQRRKRRKRRKRRFTRQRMQQFRPVDLRLDHSAALHHPRKLFGAQGAGSARKRPEAIVSGATTTTCGIPSQSIPMNPSMIFSSHSRCYRAE